MYLGNHENPSAFFQEMISSYHDENVLLFLEGRYLVAEIKPGIPLQQEIDILSFLTQRIQEQTCIA
jgi:hypothetical protein